jgi:hypothetical protein
METEMQASNFSESIDDNGTDQNLGIEDFSRDRGRSVAGYQVKLYRKG